MTCPECGLQALVDQKFCRSCGASLQITTRPLVKPETVSDQGSSSALGSHEEKRHAINFLLWGLIIMMIGVVIGVVGKRLLHEEVITVVGVLTALAGMFLVVYPYLSVPRRKRGDSHSSPQPEAFTPAQPTAFQPHENTIDYVPSVTERTTDLLKNSVGKRAGQKED